MPLFAAAYSDSLTVLAETDVLLLGHFHEDAVLLRKSTGICLLDDSFYGDPTCGVISAANDWAAVAGEHVTVWRRGLGMTRVSEPAALRWVHAMRVDEVTQQLHLLTDPWSAHPAIWELNPRTLTARKLRDFLDYQAREYVEEVPC